MELNKEYKYFRIPGLLHDFLPEISDADFESRFMKFFLIILTLQQLYFLTRQQLHILTLQQLHFLAASGASVTQAASIKLFCHVAKTLLQNSMHKFGNYLASTFVHKVQLNPTKLFFSFFEIQI